MLDPTIKDSTLKMHEAVVAQWSLREYPGLRSCHLQSDGRVQADLNTKRLFLLR